MSLSQFKEVMSHGRGEYTSAQQPWDHGLEVISAVMPILEFRQVSWDMFFGDDVISSSQGSFDISQDGVDPIKAGQAGAFVALADHNGFMFATRCAPGWLGIIMSPWSFWPCSLSWKKKKLLLVMPTCSALMMSGNCSSIFCQKENTIPKRSFDN